MHMPLLNEIKLRTRVCAYVGLILAMCMQEWGLCACYVLACFLIYYVAISITIAIGLKSVAMPV